ncbi:hypothetical protein [Zooshikella sp. RANM57]|uniref:hypothetical protein n=1 Tax=Zooshikella sp. RANM57 TaxID=3425863 RepID=UPI003D6E6715
MFDAQHCKQLGKQCINKPSADYKEVSDMREYADTNKMWLKISAKYQQKKSENTAIRKRLKKALEEARKRISKTQ